MSAPEQDEFERRLTELLRQRAATVTQVRQFDIGPADDRRQATGAGRDRRRWQHLGVLAAAAAVFVAVAGTIVAIQPSRPRTARPVGTSTSTPTSTPASTAPAKSCVAAMPVSWRQAITAGTVPVDRTINSVVSANGATGDYLAVQGNEPPPQTSAVYSDVELALFHGATGRSIYTPSSSSGIPTADPTGAITADWVAFAVTRPQNLGYTSKVMLYDRGSGSSTTLAEWTEQEIVHNKVFIGSPVIAAGKVYWLTSVYNKPETTTLDSWDLARGASAGSVPAANATALISYGSGMLISYGGGQPWNALAVPGVIRNGAGQPLTEAQLAAASLGTFFGYDGAGTLSWWRRDGGAIGYSSVKVGTAGVHNDAAIARYDGFSAAVFPLAEVFVNGTLDGLVDLRTRTLILLPEGINLQAVVGKTVIFGTGISKVGSAGLSAVPLSALPAPRC